MNGKVLDEEEASKYAKEQSVLSWKWCNKCQMNVPPRSHHCKVYLHGIFLFFVKAKSTSLYSVIFLLFVSGKICRKCILKRSHHCFLTNTCIGFTNQRYFLMMSFYLAIGCIGSLWGGLDYMFQDDLYPQLVCHLITGTFFLLLLLEVCDKLHFR